MTFIKQDVGFPVYALGWQDDTTIIASGGGGAGKFGVKNKIVFLTKDKTDVDRGKGAGTK